MKKYQQTEQKLFFLIQLPGVFDLPQHPCFWLETDSPSFVTILNHADSFRNVEKTKQ